MFNWKVAVLRETDKMRVIVYGGRKVLTYYCHCRKYETRYSWGIWFKTIQDLFIWMAIASRRRPFRVRWKCHLVKNVQHWWFHPWFPSARCGAGAGWTSAPPPSTSWRTAGRTTAARPSQTGAATRGTPRRSRRPLENSDPMNSKVFQWILSKLSDVINELNQEIHKTWSIQD